jgi:hypothetical protein
VSVREDIESDESVVIQEWRPDSGGAASDKLAAVAAVALCTGAHPGHA